MMKKSAANLMADIRHELPLSPSTYSACARCERGFARGGGVCITCCAQELGELVGQELANEYLVACGEERRAAKAVSDAEQERRKGV